MSTTRRNLEVRFPFPAGVALSVLDDRREPRSLLARALTRVPSVLMHPDDTSYVWFTLWTDLRLLRRVRRVRSGFLLTSRPAISALVAQVARPEVAVVVQEHIPYATLEGRLPDAVVDAYPGADAVVLLTDRDREQYAALLPGPPPVVRTLPNAVPRLAGDPLPARDRRRVVVAAGRLVEQKGFDLLVEAYGRVAPRHPDWRLEVYGGGPLHQQLRAQVERAGLAGVVSLPGQTLDLGSVLASSAVYALSSRAEGMPMVLLEAMSKGAAAVAFDCPTGPRELLEDGRDGLLVPAEDVPALAAALERVMSDVDLRARLGAAAVQRARAFDLDVLGPQWVALLDGLVGAHPADYPAGSAAPRRVGVR